MAKAILMSIQPKWTCKILNGEKTIEVRKKFPKDYVGWVYIYCTKAKTLGHIIKINSEETSKALKKPIGTICGINKGFENKKDYNLKGKVVARFWCDKVSVIERYCGTFIPISGYTTFLDKRYSYEGLKQATCLNDEELYRYLGNKNGYAIHITRLEVFDKPKQLDYYGHKNCKTCIANNGCSQVKKIVDRCGGLPLEKASQSWCYIEGE